MTALETSEIVTSVHVPIPRNNTGTSYLSLSARGQVDLSAVGEAVFHATGFRCKDLPITPEKVLKGLGKLKS